MRKEDKNRRKRVLVVDDDAAMQALEKELLVELGLDVDIAANGREAFWLAGRNWYDLVVMDLMMPEWNGLTAIRALAMLAPGLRIIVATGYPDHPDVEEIRKEAAVTAVLAKPFHIGKFEELIRDAVGE